MGLIRKLVILGVVGWALAKLPRDPREWPAYLGEQVALLKDQGREALQAGKIASERRQRQLEAEVLAAMGQSPAPPV